MLPLPRRAVAKHQSDRLLHELGRFENRLQRWIAGSEKNARWFRSDPLGAMRAAGLSIDDELMCELQLLMSGIARKVKRA